MMPGRWSVAFLLGRLITAGMPVRQLRGAAARIAGAQEPEVIIAALKEHEGKTELAEFLYVLTHEAVLRQKINDTTSIAATLADRMRREGHPPARLPLQRRRHGRCLDLGRGRCLRAACGLGIPGGFDRVSGGRSVTDIFACRRVLSVLVRGRERLVLQRRLGLRPGCL